MIWVTLLGAILVRVYNVGRILEFYFDQGRDALVIWRLLYEGKLFLIGPTTGIEGIFRGPWYYWLITPFYWLGKGNPVWPAVLLSLTTAVAIVLMYWLGKRLHSKEAGVVAALIGAFSYAFVVDSRWLSNPTPMFLISMILVWALLRNRWVWVAAMLGMAMQFGSAAEIFLFPAVALILLFDSKRKISRKQIVWGVGAFLITAAPQVIFNIRHDGVLVDAIRRFLTEEDTFKISFWEVVQVRLPFYYNLFMGKLFPSMGNWAETFGVIFVLVMAFKWRRYWKVMLLLVAPLVGMLFFQGNVGNVYGYYFTGYFFIFVLLFGISMGEIWENAMGRFVVIFFVLVFLQANVPSIVGYLRKGRAHTLIYEQKQMVEWVYDNAQGEPFNIDVYVPPVIPHEYEYMFKWYGKRVGNYLPQETEVELLYTIIEQDPPHPERVEAWLERQEGIGEIVEETKFGGLTVQRRNRL